MSGHGPNRTAFLGLEFDPLEQTEAASQIARFGRSRGFAYVVTPNVDHVVRLHASNPDPALWQAYRSACLCFCDSRILQLLARRSGISLSLVPGSDLTVRLLEGRGVELRSFAVIGGDRDLLEHLAARYPACQWRHHMPPMGVRTDLKSQADIIDFVERCDADVFFFAIGSPQSELLCAEIVRRGKASGIALCIGASLEFLAGIKRRAPRWMQVLALEWLFRLITEPGRLWRRYLVEGPAVFRIWWRYRISGDHGRAGCDSSSPDGR